jgi:hypothetical protein
MTVPAQLRITRPRHPRQSELDRQRRLRRDPTTFPLLSCADAWRCDDGEGQVSGRGGGGEGQKGVPTPTPKTKQRGACLLYSCFASSPLRRRSDRRTPHGTRPVSSPRLPPHIQLRSASGVAGNLVSRRISLPFPGGNILARGSFGRAPCCCACARARALVRGGGTGMGVGLGGATGWAWWWVEWSLIRWRGGGLPLLINWD